ncbi:MAG: MotA/TolQ/ExbB proton channel family protein [Bacteroidetes bacterium]|nr:MotA/TolQ/ExbB proton channel family protein [Bacteroidota bacterium]
MGKNDSKGNSNSLGQSLKTLFSAIVIPAALVIAILIFKFVMGNPVNFIEGNVEKGPLPGNYLGIIYKGGIIVPILMTMLIAVITFSLERFITITRASGKGSVVAFVRKIKANLSSNNIEAAKADCDKQKGSVANVVKSALTKYTQVEVEQGMEKEQKLAAIQKEIEEATTLEMPSLEQNLVILATITSVSTLMGLLGTVIGMIKAFAALANAGAPDSVALATGISEALINTAFGIGTAALAVIMYNVFTTKIDKLTYSIDEAGFSIVQTYAASH